MLTQLRRSAQILLIPLLIGSIGCQNHNLFSKLHGESNDPATLTAEASIALRNKDYSKAIELSNEVLKGDPNNGDALFDRAAATMGAAGLNLSVMVSDVLGQVGSSSVSSLSSASDFSDLMRLGRIGYAQDACGSASSLIAGLNCTTLHDAISSVLDDIHKIVTGQTHGTIQPNDPALLFDVGVLYALLAADTAALHGYLDVVNTNGTFNVVAGPNLSALCTTPDESDAISIVGDIGESYRSFNTLIVTSQLKDNSLTQKVRDEVNIAGQKLLTQGAGQVLPNACFAVYSAHNPPITKDNYISLAL